ncbi:hypothetical protein [Lyngbya sp. CCY1209]|uniref:nucleotide-binding protein n=1 Tax=Lyngbya sp. CCY1209 TaxID=2886103 RepID=UPI002D203417|nr:hypothetical protein [Lyngbya sp. CCY1209]MEB3883387.1 hypothetical protein [Lyngbya sp. CCY1209]
MPIKSTYAIWNNKGGVGKSSITFHISTAYAEKNPSSKVLVSDATADILFQKFRENQDRFTSPSKIIQTIQDFRDYYSVPLRDFNTSGVVAAHLGKPLSKLTQGEHQVYNRSVRVVKARIQDCQDAINDVLQKI